MVKNIQSQRDFRKCSCPTGRHFTSYIYHYEAIIEYYLWVHIDKGTIFVIVGLKYIEKQVKSIKYVKKYGTVGKSRLGENMQNSDLSRRRTVEIYLNFRLVAHAR